MSISPIVTSSTSWSAAGILKERGTDEFWIVEVMAVGLITCGEVEDVVGALTPVDGGVAQVFHDLLVELRLLLVAEVEEEEDRQEKRLRSREWSRTSQRETTMNDAEMDVKCGQDST